MMNRQYVLVKVTFIVADLWASHCAMMSENIKLPPRKRTVTIELNDDQMQKLSLKEIGSDKGSPVFEQILECFVES
jgi:hypothetical protein